MPGKIRKKETIVHEHPLHVPVSKRNPSGITIRDQRLRRLKGTYLSREDIANIFNKYDKKNIEYPTKNKLKLDNSDAYDDIIAVWTDYFNNKFKANPPLDPDVVKALIASESKFKTNPTGNPKATGIAQITPSTQIIIQNPKGEAKDFIFKDIRKKDLKEPDIAIPICIRWLFRKRKLAEEKLGRAPTHEELILEYKGLLKSKSDYKKAALKDYGQAYEKLKNK
jgi:hypothetical protein